jgi:hypothetical protein
MNVFVVSGLVRRRAELTGEIEKPHEALRKMVLDLATPQPQRLDTATPCAFRSASNFDGPRSKTHERAS